jgi:hypothetical protein
MINLFAKALKHTNASTFGVCSCIFFSDVTCLEILLPLPSPPKAHIT